MIIVGIEHQFVKNIFRNKAVRYLLQFLMNIMIYFHFFIHLSICKYSSLVNTSICIIIVKIVKVN